MRVYPVADLEFIRRAAPLCALCRNDRSTGGAKSSRSFAMLCASDRDVQALRCVYLFRERLRVLACDWASAVHSDSRRHHPGDGVKYMLITVDPLIQ